MVKKYIKFAVLACVVVLVACSETEPPPINDEIKIIDAIFEETKNDAFFNLDENPYWEMRNMAGDVAYFQAFDKDSISIATRFWDTIQYNRKQVLATLVEFVYIESGLRQRRYFALTEEQDSLIFATRNYRMLANYTLNFYVCLFKIPKTNPTGSSFMETDSTSQPVGTSTWTRAYSAEWTHTDVISIDTEEHNIWQVEYNAFDSYHTPQYYNNEFSFVENIGFYSYMGYTLVP